MIGLRFFFSLKSADVSGTGTRDEPLRTSAWEARHYTEIKGSIRKGKFIIKVFKTASN